MASRMFSSALSVSPSDQQPGIGGDRDADALDGAVQADLVRHGISSALTRDSVAVPRPWSIL